MERARLVEATMNTASFNGLFRKDRPSNLHGASTGRCVLDGNLMPALEDELALVAPSFRICGEDGIHQAAVSPNTAVTSSVSMYSVISLSLPSCRRITKQ